MTIIICFVGHNLIKLDLHHIENLTLKAVLNININCSRLRILKFSGCTFVDQDNSNTDEEILEADIFSQNQQRRFNNELKSQFVPFFELEELLISDACPESLLILILSLCINLKKLTIETPCRITDQCFEQVLINNKFQYLSQLEIRQSDLLTMKTVR